MIRRLGPSGAAVAALFSIPVSNVTVAFAQATVTPAAGAAAAATGAAALTPSFASRSLTSSEVSSRVNPLMSFTNVSKFAMMFCFSVG